MLKTLCAALLLCTTGCASIVSDSKYPVRFTTSPSGAEVLIKDDRDIAVYGGVTPFTVDLGAKSGYFKPQSYTVECNKPGYKTTIRSLSADLDGWYFGNLLFGPYFWIGFLTVDPITGAMWELDDSVWVSLPKE